MRAATSSAPSEPGTSLNGGSPEAQAAIARGAKGVSLAKVEGPALGEAGAETTISGPSQGLNAISGGAPGVARRGRRVMRKGRDGGSQNSDAARTPEVSVDAVPVPANDGLQGLLQRVFEEVTVMDAAMTNMLLALGLPPQPARLARLRKVRADVVRYAARAGMRKFSAGDLVEADAPDGDRHAATGSAGAR